MIGLLSPDSFRDKIATALKAKYPDELSDEIAEKISAGIAGAVSDATRINVILRKLLARPDKEILERMLKENRGNISALSRVLGVDRVTTYKWLAELGIDYKKVRERSR